VGFGRKVLGGWILAPFKLRLWGLGEGPSELRALGLGYSTSQEGREFFIGEEGLGSLWGKFLIGEIR